MIISLIKSINKEFFPQILSFKIILVDEDVYILEAIILQQ